MKPAGLYRGHRILKMRNDSPFGQYRGTTSTMPRQSRDTHSRSGNSGKQLMRRHDLAHRASGMKTSGAVT